MLLMRRTGGGVERHPAEATSQETPALIERRYSNLGQAAAVDPPAAEQAG